MKKLIRTIKHNAGYDELVTLTEIKKWTSDTVRSACIRNELFTCGTNETYMTMLNLVNSIQPTLENIFDIAECIRANSENQSLTNIMYILTNEAIITTYEVNGSDEI